MRKYYRKYIIKNCIDCKKEITIRSDYIKTHKGRCQKCAKLFDWSNLEYANKCSESHKGNLMSAESKKKLSESLKKVPMTE